MIKVHLLLAQGPGKPEGDLADKLTLNLILNSQGQIDVPAYEAAAQPWLAIRENGAAKSLEILRIDEGWALQSVNSLDDPLWTFEGHVYRPGELVQLRRPDGETLLYRIVSSESVEA